MMNVDKVVEITNLLNKIEDIRKTVFDNEETEHVSIISATSDNFSKLSVHISPASALRQLAEELNIETGTIIFGGGRFPETPTQTEFMYNGVKFFALNNIEVK